MDSGRISAPSASPRDFVRCHPTPCVLDEHDHTAAGRILVLREHPAEPILSGTPPLAVALSHRNALMPVSLAHPIVLVAGVYLAIGLAFALLFVTRWVGRVDPSARAGSWGFRLLVIPGSVLLWPLLVSRLLRGSTEPPEERNRHRASAHRAGRA